MSTQPRGLVDRIRSQVGFSVVVILGLFIILPLFGVRSTIPSLFLSILITIGLNVALTYYYEARARRNGGQADRGYDPRPHRTEDIRYREDRDDRYEGRSYDGRRHDRYDDQRYEPRGNREEYRYHEHRFDDRYPDDERR